MLRDIQDMSTSALLSLSGKHKNEYLEGSQHNCDLYLSFDEKKRAKYSKFGSATSQKAPVQNDKKKSDGDFQTILQAIPESLRGVIAATEVTTDSPIIEIALDEVSAIR